MILTAAAAMDKPEEKSALTAVRRNDQPAIIDADDVLLVEKPDRHKFILRGDGSDDFFKTVVVTNGSPLPAEPNDISGDDPCCMLIGENEWLITSREKADLGIELREALKKQRAVVLDADNAWLALELSGTNALLLLSRGCDLDMHPRKFGHGKSSVTQIAGVPVVIFSHTMQDGFDIYVERSLAMDLWLWFRDSLSDLNL